MTQLWNYSYDAEDVLLADYASAIDIESELVYLPTASHFTALDLKTGEVRTKIPLQRPNLQFFWSYDYFAKVKGLCGICTGESEFDWCCAKQNGNSSAHVEFLYQMPYTNEFGPTDGIYFLDKEDQTIWYQPSYLYEFTIGVNYTNAKVVFTSARNPNGSQDYCIVHDYATNRVFSYTETPSSSGLGELLPQPHQNKMLLEVPGIEDLRTSDFGTCDYDQKTHTLIGLMSNQSIYFYHAMLTNLLLMDTVSLTYKVTPLPAFQEQWDSDWSPTAVKFIPNAV